MEKRYLCADAGTTHLKLALRDESGRTLGRYATRLESRVAEDGCSEMDMDALWEAFRGGVDALGRESAENLAALGNLSGIGICAQGDGLWAIGADGRPVGPAILWNDTRASDLMPEVERLLAPRYAESRTAAQFSGANAVLLRFLKMNDPERYRRIASVLHCKDWLNYRLTGRIGTERTDAGTSVFSRTAETYDETLLRLLGIPEAAAWLPPVLASDAVIGRTIEGALPHVSAGVPVIAGGLDLAAAAFGLGVRAAGQTLCILGTTFCVLQVVDDATVAEWPKIGSILYSLVPGRSIRLLASLNGSAVLEWGRRIMGGPGIEDAEREASAAPAGCGGAAFVPFLYGERAPFRDPGACGAFVGLRAHHDRGCMLRAMYEGLAAAMRLCAESLPTYPRRVVVTGGASNSDLLCRILADTLEATVERVRVSEPGIEGIFSLLAGRRTERESDAERFRFAPGNAGVPRDAIDRLRAHSRRSDASGRGGDTRTVHIPERTEGY